MKTIQIHTDGACLGNPGPGGWGALLRWNAHERELAGGEPDTTNNRMELMAAIMALETLREPCAVVLHTDSQYVRQGITEWMPNWVRRNWKTAGGDPVKNRDLWERLHAAASLMRVLGGVAVATAGAVPMGLLLAQSRRARRGEPSRE